MRVYGTSPLYNYVELIFRCKRMFIVAVVLGSFITAFVVRNRATTYETSILVALTGNPYISDAMREPRAEKEIPASVRKARRLLIWLQNDPSFLEDVVRNAALENNYRDKTPEQLAREIRKKIAGPNQLDENYMEIGLTWPKQEEADLILNALFSRFQEKTVAIETATSAQKRQILEKQLTEVEKTWNDVTTRRTIWQTKNPESTPASLAALQARQDSEEREMSDTQLNLTEAKKRLEEVQRQLAVTPKTIAESNTNTEITIDPALAVKSELDDLKKDRDNLLRTYSNQHPRVQELDRRIAAKQQEINDLKGVKPETRTRDRIQKTAINPAYQDLTRLDMGLKQTVFALQARVDRLQQSIAVIAMKLKNMPTKDVEWNRLEKEFAFASNQRNSVMNQLQQARLDEERDKITQADAVRLAVAPKAQRADSTGKVALLYVVGPIMGLFIAFLFSLGAEALDHTLRTPVEVEKYLGKPVLAVIPQMAAPRIRRKELAGASHRSITS
jgi:uncharacterized protein involved in exopolysaccharide biosynthesis